MGAGSVSSLRHLRSSRGWAVAVIVAAFFAQLLFAPGVLAAPKNHTFSALLSLTGGTETSPKLDPVPDPGSEHPPLPFKEPCGLAIDSYGDVYVASFGEEVNGEVENGRIDIFDSSGNYIAEIHNDHEPCDLAVDSAGVLYVGLKEPTSFQGIVRYTPDVYPPTSSVDYGSPTYVVTGNIGVQGLAVNPDDDHLFALQGNELNEYGSATEGNPLKASDIAPSLEISAHGLAIDSVTDRLFVGEVCPDCPLLPNGRSASAIFVLSLSGTLLEELTGSDLPEHRFASANGNVRPAVDEATGELFVADVFEGPNHVFRFIPDSGGGYEYLADPELESHSYLWPSRIAVANGSAPNAGNVYVTSNNAPGHLFAFTPEPDIGVPDVSATEVSAVTTNEAGVTAQVNPSGAATTAHFEYVSEGVYLHDVEEGGAGAGFEHAASTPEVLLPASQQATEVNAAVEGLQPGVTYRVRAVASNHCHPSEPAVLCSTSGPEARFRTYPEPPPSAACPNEGLRTLLSRLLPDCRAYELVTPPDTNGRPPFGAGVAFGSGAFDTQLASPDGSSLLFDAVGGVLPGINGTGIIDTYESRRTSTGWVTTGAGFSGAQSQNPVAGGASPDHGYWFMSTGGGQDHGSLVIGGKPTHYLRAPDHTFSLVGEGPLNTDPEAEGRWISSNGAHVIFTSTRSLTEDASPPGVLTIYDRSLDGALTVLSLEPDGEAPQAAATVKYLGTAAGGSAIAFSVTEGGVETLYEERDGNGTAAVTQGATTFAGLSADGAYLTYLKNGDIFSFEASTGVSTPVGSGGKSTPVNVSADGRRIYFVSSKKLVSGSGPTLGKENLYLWDRSAGGLAFVATLSPADVAGVEGGRYALGSWASVVGRSSAQDPSRTTPDGHVLVFESRANLTGYDSGEHSEVFRYEAGPEPRLDCISCPPTLAPASGHAHLQIVPSGDSDFESLAPLGPGTPVTNVRDDGNAVFFQTPDPLVPGDVDGVDDVYEWQARGIDGCDSSEGCLRLISSGHSSGPNYLFAATPSGSDVFFVTPDLLTESDADVTRSLYDARINGGFPGGNASAPCSGEGCKGQPTVAPAAPSVASQVPAPRKRRPCLRKKASQNKAQTSKKGQRCHRKRRHHHHRRTAKAGRGGTR